MAEDILKVDNLKMYFPIHGGVFRRKIGKVYAVDDVSFSVRAGDTMGLVGESGCGKTTVGRSILRLYKPSGGRVVFDGFDISLLDRKQMRDLRKEMQMIFQDPFESLNSRHTIGYILEEPFIIHGIGTPGERKKEVQKIVEKVELPAGAINRYPHEFSGGQRQRIGIARAISLNPRMIICDEPVSALDVSIQSQIINLLLDLQDEMNLTYLFIAHDLAVVKHVSDQIAVMYLGKIVEYADSDTLYKSPVHPYTKALISAIPIPDPTKKKKRQTIKGDVPSPIDPPKGCRFHTRCPIMIDVCRRDEPKLIPAPGSIGTSRLVACHRAGDGL